MNTDQILNTFDPLLTAALERLAKFTKPEAKDVARFFGPVFESISRAADLEPAVLTDWLATQGPDTITRESIHAFVRSLTEAPADALAAARAKQTRLTAEIASERPLTARDRVLLERKQPLKERSRESIQAELTEANTGRMADGTELPNIDKRHWAAMEAYFVSLERELEQRDCAIAGIPYSGDRKQETGSVGYAMSPAMRG